MSASPLVTYRKTFCRLAENISSYKRSPHKSSTYNSQIKKIVTMLYQELQKLYIINKMQAKTISVLGKKKIFGKKILGACYHIRSCIISSIPSSYCLLTRLDNIYTNCTSMLMTPR